MSLGSLDHVGAPDARELARQHRAGLRAGDDPLIDRRREQRARERERTTFREVADTLLAAYDETDRHPKTRRAWRQVLEDYACPVIGNLPLDEIEQADIIRCLRPLWGTKPQTARNTRARMDAVFEEARLLKLTDKNPARLADLKRALAPFANNKPAAHHKALPWRDVPPFMAQLQASKTLSAVALRLVLLSACRTREVLGAHFDEFNHGVWTIPAERMKGEGIYRREHRVPISTGITGLLEELASARDRGPLLFANRSPTTMLSSAAMSMLVKLKGVPTSVHGLRSSFRDWAADHGYPREIAEAGLAHRVKGVEGSYFRSDLFEARRDLMQAWCDFCLSGCPSRT